MRPERHGETAGAAALVAELRHVYWIGGGSGAGKSRENLLERDRMFTERLHEETRRLELPIIEVDTTMTEDDLAERVTEAFGF
jgi:hypothetical protein